ncbi:unnamed protein product [marine sediment metagenome]|uniref:2-dehydro-3-deoxy-phosphogluconate aldolase n=1 Tax=marine sediment metagenome TaxID=412755 RepID=X1SHS9_9ZZZZ
MKVRLCDMNEVIERMGEVGIVPVIAIRDAEDAVPLVKALNAGSLPIAEITFRTEAAEESIKRIAAEVPEGNGWCRHSTDRRSGQTSCSCWSQIYSSTGF